MDSEQISKIWIDNSKGICVQPQVKTFEHIYRAAMGIQWDANDHFLYPYSVGSWTSVDWFRQILLAVKSEYGCQLYITGNTIWDTDDFTRFAIQTEDGGTSLG